VQKVRLRIASFAHRLPTMAVSYGSRDTRICISRRPSLLPVLQ
jgi:hypothetical protein